MSKSLVTQEEIDAVHRPDAAVYDRGERIADAVITKDGRAVQLITLSYGLAMFLPQTGVDLPSGTPVLRRTEKTVNTSGVSLVPDGHVVVFSWRHGRAGRWLICPEKVVRATPRKPRIKVQVRKAR